MQKNPSYTVQVDLNEDLSKLLDEDVSKWLQELSYSSTSPAVMRRKLNSLPINQYKMVQMAVAFFVLRGKKANTPQFQAEVKKKTKNPELASAIISVINSMKSMENGSEAQQLQVNTITNAFPEVASMVQIQMGRPSSYLVMYENVQNAALPIAFQNCLTQPNNAEIEKFISKILPLQIEGAADLLAAVNEGMAKHKTPFNMLPGRIKHQAAEELMSKAGAANPSTLARAIEFYDKILAILKGKSQAANADIKKFFTA